MRTIRLMTICLVLAALFTTPWRASAATLRAKRAAPEKKVEMALPVFLSRTWGAIEDLLTKAGCNIDPNGGLCSPAPTTSNQVDAGCNIDPDGRCGL